MLYKNISGQALHIADKIVQPFDVFEADENEPSVKKALEEGLIVQEITEVKPSKKAQLKEG